MASIGEDLSGANLEVGCADKDRAEAASLLSLNGHERSKMAATKAVKGLVPKVELEHPYWKGFTSK